VPLLPALGFIRGQESCNARRLLLQALKLVLAPLLLSACGGGAGLSLLLIGALMLGQDLRRLAPAPFTCNRTFCSAPSLLPQPWKEQRLQSLLYTYSHFVSTPQLFMAWKQPPVPSRAKAGSSTVSLDDAYRPLSDNSSKSALASCRSLVLNPSVNQL
jgi:hypothetical protein